MRKSALVLALSAFTGAAAASAGPNAATFRLAIRADTHLPVAGSAWGYRVRAMDQRGQPVAATAVGRVLVAGRVVDTVGWFGFKGTLRRTYRWSTDLIGSAAVLHIKVIGSGGSRLVRYAVRVR